MKTEIEKMPKEAAAQTPIAEKSSSKAVAMYAASAIVPVLVCLVALASVGCVPFGDAFPKGWDCYTQYLEYLDWYRNVLTSGGDLFYSFGKSMGGSMVGIFAYYLASPLNLIIVLFPEGSTPSFMIVVTVIKIALAGLTVSIFLSKRFDLCGLLNIALSCGYALCSYVASWMLLGFMWMDAVVWLPLIALGVYRWLTERKHMLFLVAVFMSVVSCWYTGYMLCLFAVFYFPCEYFALFKGQGIRTFLVTYLRYGGMLLVGVALSSFVLLPVVVAQMGGESVDFTFTLARVYPVKLSTGGLFIGESMWDGGAPQMCAGMLVLVGCLLFLFNRDIPTREKIARCVLFLFVLGSAYIQSGNELWCGLRIPRGYNCRFAFVLAFLMVSAAGRALAKPEGLRIRSALAGGGIAFLLAVAALFLKTFKSEAYFLTTAVLILVVTACLVLLLSVGRKNEVVGLLACIVLVCTTAVEAGVNVNYLANAIIKTDTPAQEYCDYRIAEKARYQSLVAKDDSWYRMEKTYSRLDDFDSSGFGLEPPDTEGIVLGYSGISSYSSAPDGDLYAILSYLGYSRTDMGSANYQQPIILSDALLGIKYVMNDDGSTWQNPYALSLGYAASSAILEPLDNLNTTGIVDNGQDAEGTNPFEVQNQFISKLLGRDVQVFKPLSTVVQTDSGGDHASWSVDTQGKKYAYGYVNCSKFVSGNLNVNGNNLGEYMTWEAYYVFSLGTGANGDASGAGNVPADGLVPVKLRISAELLEGQDVELLAYYADEDVLNQVIDELKQRQMDVKDCRDGYVSGTFSSDSDTLLFTTVPYDEGWSVTVNGNQVDYQKAAGAFIAIPVSAGDSQVVMTYTPKGLIPGVAISTVTLVGVLVFYWRKRRASSLNS